MWSCDIIEAIEALKQYFNEPICLESISSVMGAPVLKMVTSGRETFYYNFNEKTLTKH